MCCCFYILSSKERAKCLLKLNVFLCKLSCQSNEGAVSLTQLVLAAKQFLTSFNMYSVKPAVEPWTQILSTLGNSNQKQTICLFVQKEKKENHYFNTAALPAVSLMGRDRKLFPPAKCLWIEFLAQERKKVSEVLRKWPRRV